jgi:hypothetical protein
LVVAAHVVALFIMLHIGVVVMPMYSLLLHMSKHRDCGSSGGHGGTRVASVEKANKVSRMVQLRAAAKHADTSALRALLTSAGRKKLRAAHKELEDRRRMFHVLFATYDSDASGSIGTEEFRELARLCGEDLDEETIRSVLVGLDKDVSGSIQEEEFAQWLDGHDGGGGIHGHDGRAMAARLRDRLTQLHKAMQPAEAGAAHKVAD